MRTPPTNAALGLRHNPASARHATKKSELCRPLFTTYDGKPRLTRWSADTQHAVRIAYDKLWCAGVVHGAVAELFKRTYDGSESTNVRLCDFQQGLAKDELGIQEWEAALEKEKAEVDKLCKRMGSV